VVATHADGWFFYNVGLERVDMITRTWFDAVRRTNGEGVFKPFFEGLFLELEAIPAGLRVGRNGLINYLETLQQAGVNHTAFNPKPSRRPFTEILREMAEYVLPHFPSLN